MINTDIECTIRPSSLLQLPVYALLYACRSSLANIDIAVKLLTGVINNISQTGQSMIISALRERRPPQRRIWFVSGSGLRVRTSDPEDFQNIMGTTSLCKVTFAVKFSWRSNQFIQTPEIEAILWKNALLSRNIEQSFKKFLDPDPEADDFHVSTSSSLSTYTSVVKFLWRCVQ